eukprot:CAMPEP_0115218482 /NCGR_PEP_ID=MMETSP0270-20121206/26415_1 /TAXON_ID=71861 /ORGANISM="Scrippsiella trochoidea, Strain CCMP3099" /LENGTH=360 /DNA_ID=CAMNT_0002632429 /DNA_START=33 /DNA_END=1112 /DNA_ORIENTATION=+
MALKGEVSAVARNLGIGGGGGGGGIGGGGTAQAAWFTGGACYFYGQLLTVVAIAGASPMIVFVVKAVEPLSTALLAIPILGQRLNLALFAGLILACAGIITTYLGGHNSDEATVGLARSYSSSASLTVLSALLANLGFSGRACMVKQAYSRSGSSPLATLTTLSLTGTITGLVPVLIWPVALVLHHWYTSETAIWDRPLILTDIGPGMMRLWASASVSYCIYQCSSLLILDCVAVESHALLVAVKHVFTAILAALMVGDHLSLTSLLGAAATAAGIAIYSAAPGAKPAEGPPPAEGGLHGAGGEKLASSRGQQQQPASDEKTPLGPAAQAQQQQPSQPPPRSSSAVLASIAAVVVSAGTG